MTRDFSEPPNDEESGLDDFLLGGVDDELGDAGDDDEEAGLELGDAQQHELRVIFLTTLPQYLEPVEQMVEQLFGGAAIDAELLRALATTVESIAAAAARVGLDDVRDGMERMVVSAGDLKGGEVPDPSVRARLLQSLATIQALTLNEDGSHGGGAQPERSRTLVEAFRGIAGLDPKALEKLTAAGVVTVAQLQMARPHEVMAVSGLSAEAVQYLLEALRETPSNAPSERPHEERSTVELGPSAPPHTQQVVEQVAPTRSGHEAQVEPARMRAELRRQLRDEVEVEAELGELRVRVQQLRAQLGAERGSLFEVRAKQGRLRARLAQVERDWNESLLLAGELSERLATLRRACSKRHASQRELEAELLALERERDAAWENEARLAQGMESMCARVGGLLDRGSAIVEPSAVTNKRPTGKRSDD